MIKKLNFKQGIGIAEKSQETRRDCWGGNVNHKSLFWSIKMFKDHWVKIGICGLHYHPSDPFLFLQRSLFLVWKFYFFIILVIIHIIIIIIIIIILSQV